MFVWFRVDRPKLKLVRSPSTTHPLVFPTPINDTIIPPSTPPAYLTRSVSCSRHSTRSPYSSVSAIRVKPALPRHSPQIVVHPCLVSPRLASPRFPATTAMEQVERDLRCAANFRHSFRISKWMAATLSCVAYYEKYEYTIQFPVRERVSLFGNRIKNTTVASRTFFSSLLLFIFFFFAFASFCCVLRCVFLTKAFSPQTRRDFDVLGGHLCLCVYIFCKDLVTVCRFGRHEK